MRDIVVTLIVCLLPINALIAAEATNAFPGLKTLCVEDSNGFDIRVHYDPTVSTVLYKEGKHDFVTPVLETRIDGKEKKLYVIGFTAGMSAAPAFLIAPKGTEIDKGEGVGGTELFLPGNGSIYVSGHTNNCFNQRRKFSLKAGKLTEVKQPFQYVGLESTALVDITVFSDKKLTQAVAALPKGSPLTVLINDGSYFLVKTSFGLVGWVRYECDGALVRPVIDGLYFRGD
jgi:hypothetical protein